MCYGAANIVLLGSPAGCSQVFLIASYCILCHQVLEYDFETDVWYCHPQLPRPTFGGGHGYLPATRQVVVVGGCDRYRVSAADSVPSRHAWCVGAR